MKAVTAIRTAKNAELICARVAEGHTLDQIARELGCVKSAIVRWRLEDERFGEQYARAKDTQMDHFAEELLAIADDGTNDWVLREVADGVVVQVPDHEHINRSRLRIDARKWLMSKMAPKRYGDKIGVEHSGAGGGPVVVEHQLVLRMLNEAFAESAKEIEGEHD